ncbi:tail protein [Ochrobactrum phage vB_OspM_OC]|nr:tail protein [Ochrobactrum phage vB_OspM_OC]
MANELPRLSNTDAINSGDFSAEFSKLMAGSFARANKTMTAINARFIDDTIKVTGDMIKVDQEAYQKSVDDLKKALTNSTSIGNQPLKVEITNYHFITDKLDNLIGKIDLLSLNQNTPIVDGTPTPEENPTKPKPKNPKEKRQDENEKKDRSLFSKFMSFLQLADNKRKMKGGAMDEDWLKKGGALASLLLNPSEHVSVMSRMLVGRLLLKLNTSLFSLINGIIGATFSTLGGLTAVIIGSVLSTTMLKAGIGMLARVFSKINPLMLILTGLGTMAYDAVTGWMNTEGSMGDKAIGALKSAFLEGGVLKMTGKWAAMGATIGMIGGPVGSLAGGIIGSVIGLVLGLVGGDTIAAWTSAAWESLKELPGMIWNGIEGVYNWTRQKVQDLIAWFQSIPDTVSAKIDEWVSSSEAWANENIINPVMTKIDEWSVKVLAFFQPAIDLFNNVSNMLNGISIEGIQNTLQESIDKFYETFDWITGSITRWFDEKIGQLKNLKDRILGIFNYGETTEELDKIEPVELTPESRERMRARAANMNTSLDRSSSDGNMLLDSMNLYAEKNKESTLSRNSGIKPGTEALNDYNAGIAAAGIAANFVDNSRTSVNNTSVTNASSTSVNTPLGPTDRQGQKANLGY